MIHDNKLHPHSPKKSSDTLTAYVHVHLLTKKCNKKNYMQRRLLQLVTCNFIWSTRYNHQDFKKNIYIYSKIFSTIYSEKKTILHFDNTIKNACFPWMPCILITDYFKKYSLQPDLNELRDSACRRPVGKLFHKTAPLYLKLFFR